MSNADVIRTRADRAIAHLRDNRALLRHHGHAVDYDMALIARLADKAIADGRRPYDFAIIVGIAGTIARTGARVRATSAFGPLTPEDTGLVTIALNLQAIDSDRPDSDLIAV